jgi:hypothetical protein
MPPPDISMRLLVGTSAVRGLVPVNTDADVITRLERLFPDHEIIGRWVSDEAPIPGFTETYAENHSLS